MSSYFYGNKTNLNEGFIEKIKEKSYTKKYSKLIDEYYNLGNKLFGQYNFYIKLNRSEVKCYSWGGNDLQFDIGWFNVDKMYESITGKSAKEAHEKEIICKQLETEIEKLDKEFSKLDNDNIHCLIQYQGISNYFKNNSEEPKNFTNDYGETPAACVVIRNGKK